MPPSDSQSPPSSTALRDSRPLSDIKPETAYDCYTGSRSGPTLTIELREDKLIILPYIQFSGAIYRDGEILLDFSWAHIQIAPKGDFPVAEFLDAISELRVKRFVRKDSLASVTVMLDAPAPKESTL